MTQNPTALCGALLPWGDGGPPSVCAREDGHTAWHLSADDVEWAGKDRVAPGCPGGMSWFAADGWPFGAGVAA